MGRAFGGAECSGLVTEPPATRLLEDGHCAHFHRLKGAVGRGEGHRVLDIRAGDVVVVDEETEAEGFAGSRALNGQRLPIGSRNAPLSLRGNFVSYTITDVPLRSIP